MVTIETGCIPLLQQAQMCGHQTHENQGLRKGISYLDLQDWDAPVEILKPSAKRTVTDQGFGREGY